jgi:hypothetical protein
MKKKLYIETRLYNVNDRMASLALCEHIDQWIDQKLLGDLSHCYLPYRDSDSQIPEGCTDVGQAIFDLDIQNLNTVAAGVAGFFDGPHYDSGCAFEVGYAYAKGLPVNLISTDFYKWSVGDSPGFYVGSKLLNYTATVVSVPRPDEHIKDYRRQCEAQREQAFGLFQHNLIKDFGTGKVPRPPLGSAQMQFDYYLDPNFKYTETGRIALSSIVSIIEREGKSYIIGDNQGDIAVDIERLRRSGRAVFFAEPFEPNVDSSILHGIAYGVGCKPVLYSSNMQRFNAGTFSGRRNNMVSHSAEAVISSLDDLSAIIN